MRTTCAATLSAILLTAFCGGAFGAEHCRPTGALQEFRLGSICVAGRNAELDRRLASFHDDRLTVIDMYDKFVDAEGNISLDLTIDYLHPTAKGYDLWGAALAPIIEKEYKTTQPQRPVRATGENDAIGA